MVSYPKVNLEQHPLLHRAPREPQHLPSQIRKAGEPRMTSSAGGTDSCRVQLSPSTLFQPSQCHGHALGADPERAELTAGCPLDAALPWQGPQGWDATTPRPRSFPRRAGQRRQRSPAELPAGAEAVPLLEGLRADGRTDLRQEPAPPPGSPGRRLRWRRPVTAGATGRRLLVGAHGAELLPRQGERLLLPLSSPRPCPGIRVPSRPALPQGAAAGSRVLRAARAGRGGGAQPRGPAPRAPHLGGRA